MTRKIDTTFQPSFEQLDLISNLCIEGINAVKAKLRALIEEPHYPGRDTIQGYMIANIMDRAALYDAVYPADSGRKRINLQPSEEQLARLQALIAEHSHPELAEQEGHVLQFWYDGEVTSQKAGSLLNQRNLHQVQRGFGKGVDFDGLEWPNNKNVYTDKVGEYALRACMLEIITSLLLA